MNDFTRFKQILSEYFEEDALNSVERHLSASNECVGLYSTAYKHGFPSGQKRLLVRFYVTPTSYVAGVNQLVLRPHTDPFSLGYNALHEKYIRENGIIGFNECELDRLRVALENQRSVISAYLHIVERMRDIAGRLQVMQDHIVEVDTALRQLIAEKAAFENKGRELYEKMCGIVNED